MMKQLVQIVRVLGVLLAVSGAGSSVSECALGATPPRAQEAVGAPSAAKTSDGAEEQSNMNQATRLRPHAGSIQQRIPTSLTEKTIALSTWENVALAIPPNRAGCGPQGAVLVAGDGPRIWRGSLKCFASQSSQCPATSDVHMGSTDWPAVNVAGFTEAIYGPDKQLVRFPDGTLLLVQQGVRRDAGTTADCATAEGTCRGTEYLFHSTDCGSSWSLVSVLDPATDGPAAEPDRYYDHSTQHGHDRPELYADVFHPGRVYMTVVGWGDTAARIVLYRSDDMGVTWNHAAELPLIWWGAYMTSVPSGKLYIGAWYGAGPPHAFGVLSYNPIGGAVSGPFPVGFDLARAPGTRMSAGGEGISRIGSLPSGDYLRMHNTYRTDSGDYGLVVRVVRVSRGAVSVVGEYRYVPPAGSSVVGPGVVETDRLEWQSAGKPDPAFIYWYETSTVGNNGSNGPALARGQRFDGTIPGERFCLSLDGSGCRSWPLYNDVYGDYQRGAFWYDLVQHKLGFLALWAEQGTNDSRAVHTNVLTVKTPMASKRVSPGLP